MVFQEAERYYSLAQKSHQVVIMAAPPAEHPTSQLPNVTLVGLDPGDPVAQEALNDIVTYLHGGAVSGAFRR